MDYPQKLQELSRLKAEMTGHDPLSPLETQRLAQNIRIEHVWSSNAIEGSKLNEAETAAILNTGRTIAHQPVTDVLAALDLNRAYEYMLELVDRQQALTATLIRDLNRLVMLRNTADQSAAGAYRKIAVWPYGAEDHPYTDPLEVPFEIDRLIEWSRQAQPALHPVQYAADLHFRFVSIHPFVDGNGRTARLLMNLALLQAGYPVVNIQPDPASRSQYIQALARGREDDLQSFEGLIADYTLTTLRQRIGTLELNERNIEIARQETVLFKDRLQGPDEGNN